MQGSRVTYVVVKEGETLEDLSARYQTSPEEIRQLNRGIHSVAPGDLIKVVEQEPNFREPVRRTHHVLGFYAGPMGMALPGSQGSFERHASLLSSIAPYWFDLDATNIGRIKLRTTPTAIRSLIADAHRRKIKVLASIHNTDKLGGVSRLEVVHDVIGSHRKAFYNQLFALLHEYGFDGVNLDFEHLREGDKALFTEFVRELTDQAHRQGYIVVVDVLGDARKTPFSLDFDYPGLAAHANYLAILTYDQFKPSEPQPGPVASLPWTRETVEKAIAEGVPARKILLGVPTYGYEWTVGHKGARALSYAAVEKLRRQHNATARFHPTFKVPHFTYRDEKGQEHEVWYEDARSMALKLDLVNRLGLGGIVLWRLGLEDPATWGPIRAKLSPIE